MVCSRFLLSLCILLSWSLLFKLVCLSQCFLLHISKEIYILLLPITIFILLLLSIKLSLLFLKLFLPFTLCFSLIFIFSLLPFYLFQLLFSLKIKQSSFIILSILHSLLLICILNFLFLWFLTTSWTQNPTFIFI